MSMTSQHSYFYQADVAADITEVSIDQGTLDDLNFSAIAMGAKVGNKKLEPSDLHKFALTAS